MATHAVRLDAGTLISSFENKLVYLGTHRVVGKLVCGKQGFPLDRRVELGRRFQARSGQFAWIKDEELWD